MFLEPLKLETNPFSPDQIRPRLESRSSRQSSLTFGKLLDGQIHCLFLSGPARVGKSTLAARCLRDLEDESLSVIDPWIKEPEVFLRKVLSDLGLEAPGATTGELKNILQVYLHHHSAANRRAVLMVDHLEQIEFCFLLVVGGGQEICPGLRPGSSRSEFLSHGRSNGAKSDS